MSFIVACCGNRDSIPETKALQICKIQLDSLGLNPDSVDIHIYPYPLTSDSAHTAAGHIPFMRQSDWLKRTQNYIGNKAFWDCICRVKSKSIGYCFIYIDSHSGDVLFVLDFGANAPKHWIHSNYN